MPFARLAAIAEERVQPVPWVSVDAERAVAISIIRSPSNSRSTASRLSGR